jgi:periodic tryptophan protein 1
MISALTWIPRGAAREHPIRYELSEEEMKMMMKNYKSNDDVEDDAASGTESDIEEQAALPVDINDLPKELNMDKYDDDSDDMETMDDPEPQSAMDVDADDDVAVS